MPAPLATQPFQRQPIDLHQFDHWQMAHRGVWPRRKRGFEYQTKREVQMIAFRRTISVMPGMFSAAMAYANELKTQVKATAGAMAYANELKTQVKATAGVDLKIAIPVGGNPHRIAWLSTHENLAQLDTVTQKLLADQKYQELLKKGAGIVVPESVFDDIWWTF
jgi:hypothetical protein